MARTLSRFIAAAAVGLAVVSVPAVSLAQLTDQPRPTAQLFEGMGKHHRTVTNASPEAQRYFDQGLTWAFSFNHDEAIRSFQEAARLSPDCAMAYWGIALCNGPHINNPAVDEEHSKAAWEALQKAAALQSKASREERALISALTARYADPSAGKLPFTPEERAPLDKAYAGAMGKVRAEFPKDNDIGTLYAESMMDLRPWDLWSVKGEPRPETPEIVKTLEEVLASDPNHPGANHLYIHAVEASPHADRGIAAADRLRTMIPASGHMVHMPGHIDVRVGRWDKAAEQNRRAIEVDSGYRKLSPKQGFYHIYMAHNHQFLSWACMMEGRSEESVRAAREMIAGVPSAFIEHSPAAIDGYLGIPYESMMRFGRWDDMLKEPAPPEVLPITTSIWRFSRAIAYAAKGEIDEAKKEQGVFREAVKKVPPGAIMAINPAETVLSLADHVLEGEIAFRQGDTEKAIANLTKAVELEDTLRYMEPPDWLVPVRHTLGAVLLNADRPKEAEKVYRDDLVKWPENGWALFGLAQALKAQGSPDADAVEARFQKAWANADIKLEATCLCVPGKGK